MNIVIVGSHAWPVPTPPNTGHRVYLDLAEELVRAGHNVQLVAPAGTRKFGGSGGGSASLLEMPCANGTAEPPARECESEAQHRYADELAKCDIIHDWSCEKTIADMYPHKSVSTVMSGNFDHPRHGRNVVVWSKEMQQRAYRGASDYEGTEFTQWHSVSRALADAHVVPGGVDTEFWTPGDGERGSHLLWLGRWHEARGYRLAIDLARANPDIELVMAGEAPGDALNAHQTECAMDAVNYATGLANVRFEWLPKEGHREAVREQYRKAKAYLFTPLFHEPFGLSQVEAMACGTPVIATSMGSTREVVGDKGGWVPYGGNQLANLKNGVAALLYGRHGLTGLSIRDYAVRNFDRSVMAKAYLREYQNVLDGKGWG